MCTYIVVVLPKSADLAEIRRIFAAGKFGFELVPVPHALHAVAPDDVLVLPSGGNCDCGTPLGSLTRSSHNSPLRWDIHIEKLRKKGWSEAKIERWKQQKKQKGHRSGEAVGVPTPLSWINLVTEVLNSGYTLRLGLLLLWSNLQYDSNRGMRQERMPVGDLSVEQLLRLDENVVYNYERN